MRQLLGTRLRQIIRPILLCSSVMLLIVSAAGVNASTQALPQKVAAESAWKKKPMVIAHRGGRKWAPENTMIAFKKSMDAGVDGVELDIHRCKSGELVVIHDETLDRTTDGKGLVKDFTWDEIKKLSAGKWYAKEFESERVPLLSEVLDAYDGKMLINIEIKNTPIEYVGIEDDLIKLLGNYKHPERIMISSFDHELIRRIHEKSPIYEVAFLDASIIADVGEYGKKLGATAWNAAHYELRPDAVEKAQKSGLSVNVWTVDGIADWKKSLEWNVDGIVTDDPAGLIEFLKSDEAKASLNKSDF